MTEEEKELIRLRLLEDTVRDLIEIFYEIAEGLEDILDRNRDRK